MTDRLAEKKRGQSTAGDCPRVPLARQRKKDDQRVTVLSFFFFLSLSLSVRCFSLACWPASPLTVAIASVCPSHPPQYWESLFSCKLPTDLPMADDASITPAASLSHKRTARDTSFTLNDTNSINSSVNSRVPRSKLTFLRHNQQQKHLTSMLNKRLQDASSSSPSSSSSSSPLFSSASSDNDSENDYDNRPICDPDARIDASTGYRQETKVQFVVDAVYAFAEALHAAWLDLCRSKDRVCKELKELDGGVFYKNYLLKVNFTGEMYFNLFYILHSIAFVFFLSISPLTLLLRPLQQSPLFYFLLLLLLLLTRLPILFLLATCFFSSLSLPLLHPLYALLRLDQVPFLPLHITSYSSGSLLLFSLCAFNSRENSKGVHLEYILSLEMLLSFFFLLSVSLCLALFACIFLPLGESA